MKTYTKSDVTRAYRVSNGAEVTVPKAWLTKGHPYAGAYTRENPAKAAEKAQGSES